MNTQSRQAFSASLNHLPSLSDRRHLHQVVPPHFNWDGTSQCLLPEQLLCWGTAWQTLAVTGRELLGRRGGNLKQRGMRDGGKCVEKHLSFLSSFLSLLWGTLSPCKHSREVQLPRGHICWIPSHTSPLSSLHLHWDLQIPNTTSFTFSPRHKLQHLVDPRKTRWCNLSKLINVSVPLFFPWKMEKLAVSTSYNCEKLNKLTYVKHLKGVRPSKW